MILCYQSLLGVVFHKIVHGNSSLPGGNTFVHIYYKGLWMFLTKTDIKCTIDLSSRVYSWILFLKNDIKLSYTFCTMKYCINVIDLKLSLYILLKRPSAYFDSMELTKKVLELLKKQRIQHGSHTSELRGVLNAVTRM